jgi:hypothetical protein
VKAKGRCPGRRRITADYRRFPAVRALPGLSAHFEAARGGRIVASSDTGSRSCSALGPGSLSGCRVVAAPVANDMADGSSVNRRRQWLPELVADHIADGSSVNRRRQRLPAPVADHIADGSSVNRRRQRLPAPVADDMADGSSVNRRRQRLPELVADDMADGSSSISANGPCFRVLHGRSLLWVVRSSSSRLVPDVSARKRTCRTNCGRSLPAIRRIRSASGVRRVTRS